MNYILEEMDKLGAEGVDFVSICEVSKVFKDILCSYTKEQLEKGNITSFPRSVRLYWKMVDGKKTYLTDN